MSNFENYSYALQGRSLISVTPAEHKCCNHLLRVFFADLSLYIASSARLITSVTVESVSGLKTEILTQLIRNLEAEA